MGGQEAKHASRPSADRAPSGAHLQRYTFTITRMAMVHPSCTRQQGLPLLGGGRRQTAPPDTAFQPTSQKAHTPTRPLPTVSRAATMYSGPNGLPCDL